MLPWLKREALSQKKNKSNQQTNKKDKQKIRDISGRICIHFTALFLRAAYMDKCKIAMNLKSADWTPELTLEHSPNQGLERSQPLDDDAHLSQSWHFWKELTVYPMLYLILFLPWIKYSRKKNWLLCILHFRVEINHCRKEKPWTGFSPSFCYIIFVCLQTQTGMSTLYLPSFPVSIINILWTKHFKIAKEATRDR